MAKEGSVYGVFKDTSTQYYVPDNLLYNDCSDTETCVLDTDPNDYECFINMHNEYMVYINDSDTIYSTDSDSNDIIIPSEVLEGPWDSEEYYFQQSTVYDNEVLDVIIIMWYFKSIGSGNFFFDYKYVKKTVDNGINRG
ncbi:hypothetical protein QPL51_04730 [Escherichia coli]|uniref:hypothetical protein n=1 Tax=Escherichia coli TaxID=562 RepID=UPI00287B0521|nr:hypothetical protein [Escherichia coli]MDS1552343.1 hypothetical protein [Escherichia coli]